jgi:hypothetical protein
MPVDIPSTHGGSGRQTYDLARGPGMGSSSPHAARDPEGNDPASQATALVRGIDRIAPRTSQADRIPTWDGFSERQLPHRTPRRPTFSLVSLGVEPPAGIEPATPSLPSMRRWFTTPCSTSCLYTTAQVSSAAKGWVVGRREAARSTVSGKSLARACTAVHDMDAGAIVRSPADSRLAPQVQCCPRQLRVERRANGEVHPLWQTGTRQPVGYSMSACLGRKTGRALVR